MVKLIALALFAWGIWKMLKKPARRPLALDEREARDVLGVGMDEGPDAIRAAHRRLVSAVHPDRGGSADLTRRINAARDVLLRGR